MSGFAGVTVGVMARAAEGFGRGMLIPTLAPGGGVGAAARAPEGDETEGDEGDEEEGFELGFGGIAGLAGMGGGADIVL